MGEGRDYSDSMEGMEHDLGEEVFDMVMAYDKAKAAKVGTMISCPSCGTIFKKRTYHQVFNSNKGRGNCKDRFWNIVPDDRRERTKRYLDRDSEKDCW